MFFMLGMWPGRKDLGMVSGCNVYMTYNAVVIFFIPIFKYDKRYFAEKGFQTYEIDEETGKRIERGEEVTLHFTGQRAASWTNAAGTSNYSGTAEFATSDVSNPAEAEAGQPTEKVCTRCGFRTNHMEYKHCPMCANKL